MKTFRRGGIHPPENKLTNDCQITELPLPGELRVMLAQCIGAPPRPTVKPGDRVACGDRIVEVTAFVSAPVHSPVNGIVKKLEPTRTPQGIWQDSIVIEPDKENPISYPEPRTKEETDALSPKEIVEIIGDMGVVGLGGATFPTRVKLSVPEGKSVDYLLINGAECEPCLTCDNALMKEHPEEIVEGTLLLMRAAGAEKGIFGIEENKPDAIKAMKAAVAGKPQLRVVTLKKKYPQGGEKQLIFATTGRIVPAGGLPIATGCIVDNVATAYAVYQAVRLRRPLTDRVVTVTGPGLSNPGNFLVKNGTSLNDILTFAGGLPDDTGKIIAGGPMMGRAISATDSSATKGLSGLVVLPHDEALRKPEGPCIRCARCVGVCPMGLEPYLLMLQADVKRWDDMAQRGVMNCLECGSCTYICPSNRPHLDMIKLGKQELRKKK